MIARASLSTRTIEGEGMEVIRMMGDRSRRVGKDGEAHLLCCLVSQGVLCKVGLVVLTM